MIFGSQFWGGFENFQISHFSDFWFHQLFDVKYVNNGTKYIKYGRKKVTFGLKLLWGVNKHICKQEITSNLTINHKIWEKIVLQRFIRLDTLHCIYFRSWIQLSKGVLQDWYNYIRPKWKNWKIMNERDFHFWIHDFQFFHFWPFVINIPIIQLGFHKDMIKSLLCFIHNLSNDFV